MAEAPNTIGSPSRFSELDAGTLLENVLETMAGGLFTVDAQGAITSWNGAMEEMTGYSADDVLGRACDLLEGDTCMGGPTADGRSRCALFNGDTLRAKPCHMRTRDGRTIAVLKNARLMHADDGTLVGAIESVTDVSTLVELKGEVARLRSEVTDVPFTRTIIGRHSSMGRLMDMVRIAASNDFPVLVQGETGTGKELVARAIHEASARRSGPFVRVSCAALSETVLESELFGHVRGAFTGAQTTRKGRFEEADGGTLLLDEIGDISPNVQKKLLRVLQESEFERVGDNRTIRVDIRVVAVTNCDLRHLADTREFRSDLYYRLAVIPITVPPLRDRVADIPLLVEFFVDRLNRMLDRGVAGVTREALERLIAHSWPGNVRELEHAIEFAIAVGAGDRIDVRDLPASVRAPRHDPHPSGPERPIRRSNGSREDVEAALRDANGKRVEAARALGVSRVTLWKWMKRYGLDGEPGVDDES